MRSCKYAYGKFVRVPNSLTSTGVRVLCDGRNGHLVLLHGDSGFFLSSSVFTLPVSDRVTTSVIIVMTLVHMFVAEHVRCNLRV